jgi:quercetin dioxygenase-like cupin family protein
MLAVYNRKHSLHSIPHAYHARLPRQRARSILLAAIVVVLHAGYTPNASGQVIRERVEISPHPTTKTATTSSSLALLLQDGPVAAINTLPGVRVSVTGTSFQAGGTIPPHASVEIFIRMEGEYTVLTVWADGRGEVFQVKPPVPPRDLLYCGAQVYVTYCLRWWGVFSCTYRYKLASASVSGSTATFTIQDFLSDGWYVNVPFTATVTVGAEPLPGYELAQVIVAPGKTSLQCVDQTTVAMTLKNDLGQNLSICSGAMTTTVSLTGVGPYAFLRRGTQEGQTLSIPMTSATASF